MIQANELRVNNLVQYKWFKKSCVDGIRKLEVFRETVKILAIDGQNNKVLVKTNETRNNYTWTKIDKIRPILLTEEWLVKLGFEWSPVLQLYGLKEGNTIFEPVEVEDYEAGHYIHFYHNGEYLLVESINDHGEYSNLMFEHIKFVHQLQNLYFALTGQELEVKL